MIEKELESRVLMHMSDENITSQENAKPQLIIVNGLLEIMQREGAFVISEKGRFQDKIINVFDKMVSDKMISEIDDSIKKSGNTFTVTSAPPNYKYYLNLS